MKTKNICKFIPAKEPEKLEINCFILESNIETMETETKLSCNMAILVKQGKTEFYFSDEKITACAGNLLFGFEGETFYAKACEGCEYMYIKFSGSRSDTLFRRFGINRIKRCFANFDGLIPLWHDSLSRASEENIDLASESILLYTFSRITVSGVEKNNLVNTVVDITEQNFVDSSLSISSIADELSYNPKYLSHLFKEKMGMRYSEYLRMLRVKYAVTLFDRGLDSVKNIAYLSGFDDPLYFSTVFKKVVGVSPKEYKEKEKER